MKTKRSDNVLVNVYGVVYSTGGFNEKYEQLNTIEILDPVTEQCKISDATLHIERWGH